MKLFLFSTVVVIAWNCCEADPCPCPVTASGCECDQYGGVKCKSQSGGQVPPIQTAQSCYEIKRLRFDSEDGTFAVPSKAFAGLKSSYKFLEVVIIANSVKFEDDAFDEVNLNRLSVVARSQTPHVSLSLDGLHTKTASFHGISGLDFSKTNYIYELLLAPGLEEGSIIWPAKPGVFRSVRWQAFHNKWPDFTGSKSLSSLQFNGKLNMPALINSLKTAEPNAVRELTLDFKDPSVVDFPFEMFPNLHSIYLIQNKIAELSTSFISKLQALPGIVRIELGGNRITKIPANAFSNLPKSSVLTVNLLGNQISKVDDLAFSGLRNVMLDLAPGTTISLDVLMGVTMQASVYQSKAGAGQDISITAVTGTPVKSPGQFWYRCTARGGAECCPSITEQVCSLFTKVLISGKVCPQMADLCS